jgi:hypothetical protein
MQEAWKAMLALKWMTVAARGLDQLYVVLAFAQRFTCKTALFESGRCWDRTSDLCRVKAVRLFARGFWSLQNSCKSPYFYIDAFPSVSEDLPGLLHGCCTSGFVG